MKYHNVFEDSNTRKTGFLCRLINFLEDILEDAECRDILVEYNNREVVVQGVDCKYNLRESIELFQDKYSVNARVESIRGNSMFYLYHRVLEDYLENYHRRIIEHAWKTRETNTEYYFGVTMNGVGFLLEGEEDRVVIPHIPLCISAHTHPHDNPLPSRKDWSAIKTLFTEGGVLHAIVTTQRSLVIHRTNPLTMRDYELLLEAEKPSNPLEVLTRLVSYSIKYIVI